MRQRVMIAMAIANEPDADHRRRADDGARRDDPGADPRRAADGARGDRRRDRADHARPRRRRGLRRPRRRDVRGQARRDRHRRRRVLSPAHAVHARPARARCRAPTSAARQAADADRRQPAVARAICRRAARSRRAARCASQRASRSSRRSRRCDAGGRAHSAACHRSDEIERDELDERRRLSGAAVAGCGRARELPRAQRATVLEVRDLVKEFPADEGRGAAPPRRHACTPWTASASTSARARRSGWSASPAAARPRRSWRS